MVCSCGIEISLSEKKHSLACFPGEHKTLLEKPAEDFPLLKQNHSSSPDETHLFERKISSSRLSASRSRTICISGY
jgi:hypothetical protein